MQIWAESGKSALPIVTIHKSYISFLTFTQNLKRSLKFCIIGIEVKLDAKKFVIKKEGFVMLVFQMRNVDKTSTVLKQTKKQ